MRLFTDCQNCKEEIPVKSSAKTRSELEKEKGVQIQLNCQNCGETADYHANDIQATVSGKTITMGVLLGFFLTAVLGPFLGGLSLLGMGAAILIWRNQENTSGVFNESSVASSSIQ